MHAFKFQLSVQDGPCTRRRVLSTVNSVFDPIGLIAPVLIEGKIILRKMMTETSMWDEPLSGELRQEWVEWKQSLTHLENLNIQRTYVTTSIHNSVRRELYVFCDASEKAIAAVAYFKVTDIDGVNYTGFVLGKTKVAPSHGQYRSNTYIYTMSNVGT